MAKKNEAQQSNAAMNASGEDADIIKEAYREEMKKHVMIFLDAHHRNPAEAEKNFIDGLATVRAARDRVNQLF